MLDHLAFARQRLSEDLWPRSEPQGTGSGNGLAGSLRRRMHSCIPPSLARNRRERRAAQPPRRGVHRPHRQRRGPDAPSRWPRRRLRAASRAASSGSAADTAPTAATGRLASPLTATANRRRSFRPSGASSGEGKWAHLSDWQASASGRRDADAVGRQERLARMRAQGQTGHSLPRGNGD